MGQGHGWLTVECRVRVHGGVGLALGEAFRSGFVFLSALAQTNGLSSYEYNKGTI